MYAASSACARGMIPGSLNAVRSNVAITNINSQPATMGIATDNSVVKNGQLKYNF